MSVKLTRTLNLMRWTFWSSVDAINVSTPMAGSPVRNIGNLLMSSVHREVQA